MNKLVHYSAKLSLAGAVAVALLVLGGASIFAPAFATHAPNHDEIARGKIGALEERVWSCENNMAPCAGKVGAPGFDGPLADLECDDGQTVAWDNAIEGFACSNGGGGGASQALIENFQFLLEVNASAYVFVTSETYTGDLVGAANDAGLGSFTETDGIAAGNALCQERADAADLPGSYSAWLADAIHQPSSNFSRFTTDDDQPFSPYVLPNGDRVADNWQDLTAGSLINAISHNEFGELVSGTPLV